MDPAGRSSQPPSPRRVGRRTRWGVLCRGQRLHRGRELPRPGTPVPANAGRALGWVQLVDPGNPQSLERVVRCAQCRVVHLPGSACIAVGGTEDDDIVGPEETTPVAESWDGSSWSMVSTPSVPVGSVSCTSSTDCTAIGSTALGPPVSERWNGSTWSAEATAIPFPGSDVELSAVSCTSSTSSPPSAGCTAVGSGWLAYVGGTQARPLIERWEGANWSIQGARSERGPAGAESGRCVVLLVHRLHRHRRRRQHALGRSTLERSALDVRDRPCANGRRSHSSWRNLLCVAHGLRRRWELREVFRWRAHVGGALERHELVQSDNPNPDRGPFRQCKRRLVQLEECRCTAVGWDGDGAIAARWNGSNWRSVQLIDESSPRAPRSCSLRSVLPVEQILPRRRRPQR